MGHGQQAPLLVCDRQRPALRLPKPGRDRSAKGAKPAQAKGADPPPPRASPRPVRRAMHGWIILDKPVGLGSTQAVGAVKRLLREAGETEDQGRPWRHARSAGQRRAADRAGRGDQARRADARQRQSAMTSPSPSGVETDTLDTEGAEIASERAVAPDPGGGRRRSCRALPGRSSRPAVLFRRSRSTASGPMTSRAPARPRARSSPPRA